MNHTIVFSIKWSEGISIGLKLLETCRQSVTGESDNYDHRMTPIPQLNLMVVTPTKILNL